jgi:hypothetical protein
MPKKKRRTQSPRMISTDHIETQSLSLVDQYGVQRAALTCDGGEGGLGGSTVLHFYGDDGAPRVTLQVQHEGGIGIIVFSEGGKPALSIAANQASGNGVNIADQDGKPRIMAGVPGQRCDMPGGAEPQIVVVTKDGKASVITGNGLEV